MAIAWSAASCGAPAVRSPASPRIGGPDHLVRAVVCSRSRPFAYRQSSGALTGFDVELLEAIAKKLRVGIGFAEACDGLVPKVADGRADLGAAELAIRPGLREGAALSDPYFVPTLGLTVAPASRLRLHAVEGLTQGDLVGVRTSSEGARWAAATIEGRGVRLRRFPSAGALFEALAARRLDAAIDDESISWAEIENRPALRVVQSIDTGVRFGFVVNDDDPGLLEGVNVALQAVVASGTYTRIFAKYFPGTTLPAMFQAT